MVRRYEKELLRICCVYLRDRTAAEDAVQETFLKLYQNGMPVEGYGTEGIRAADEQTLVFTLMFNRVDALENLMLIPDYSRTGEHPNEAISIEQLVK